MRLKSLMQALERFVSKVGSEQSTNCRWWDSRARPGAECRLDLKHPPTAVGGISTFHTISLPGDNNRQTEPRSRVNGFSWAARLRTLES